MWSFARNMTAVNIFPLCPQGAQSTHRYLSTADVVVRPSSFRAMPQLGHAPERPGDTAKSLKETAEMITLKGGGSGEAGERRERRGKEGGEPSPDPTTPLLYRDGCSLISTPG